MNKNNVKVDNQIHKIKVDSLFPIRLANTILSQLPRTCFAVLVYIEVCRILWILLIVEVLIIT